METLADRHILILGLARQGTALARYLVEQGANVTISDRRTAGELQEALVGIAGLPVRTVPGGHPESLLDGTDLLCLSGGVPVELPIVIEAQRRGIPLSNDAQLFLERCPAPVIGITGAAGKTTTTALTGEMCRAAGFRTWVGGNIGNPLISDLGRIAPEDRVVMELSSFQLEIMSVSPHVAAVLNITPNHLDRHGTMERYIAAKQSIVAFQGTDDAAVLSYDEPNARALAGRTPARVLFFSTEQPVPQGAYLDGDALKLRLDGHEELLCRTGDVRLRGRHNLLNVLAAGTLAALAGAGTAALRRAVGTFAGVEHRLELVCRSGGVSWYDDSIATAPERSLAALRAFDEPIVLLAGGRDKNLLWEEFAAETLARVRYLVLFGEAAGLIAGHVERARARAEQTGSRLEGMVRAGTLEEAVACAARVARPGDVVLLSPGGTSFDAFEDFAARGDRFKQLVRAVCPTRQVQGGPEDPAAA